MKKVSDSSFSRSPITFSSLRGLFLVILLAAFLTGCGPSAQQATLPTATATPTFAIPPQPPSLPAKPPGFEQGKPPPAVSPATAAPQARATLPPTPTLPPEQQRLVVYEQQVLYDRRFGAERGAIMLSRQAIVVNHTNQTQRLRIAAPVNQAAVDYGLDYNTGFSIYRDLISETGFSLPPDDLIQVLPQAPLQPQTGGGSLTIWDSVELAPGHAALTGFSSLWSNPQDLYHGQSIVLPGLQVDPTAQLDTAHLTLNYDVRALEQTVEGVRFSIFLPTTTSPGPGAPPDTSLYQIASTSSDPAASQVRPDMFQVDGRMNMAQGTTYFFEIESIAKGSNQMISIEADIERSGKPGHVIPYLTVVYYHHSLAAPTFEVQPELAATPIHTLTPVFISNISMPDLNDLEF